MKTSSMLKTLSIATLASLALTATAAQADGCFNLPFQSTGSSCASNGPGQAPACANQADARLDMQRSRMEMALRGGQITPWEAGRLMRAQWEMEQFRRGFLADGRPNQGESCAANPDLAATLAPLGSMAASGMQTASTVMRALMKEATRLIQEQANAEAQQGL